MGTVLGIPASSEVLSAQWRTWMKAAIVIACLSMFTFAFQRESALPDAPMTEDAYYSLAVARSLAAGHGLTVDGEHWTNGFQPLFTVLVCAPIFVVTGGDRIAAIRGLYLASFAIMILTALALAQIVYAFSSQSEEQRRLRAYVTVLAYVTSAQLWRFHYNGLETGWLIFMYVLAWLYYQRIGTHTWLRSIGFGALLGLVILSRIDAAFLVVVVCAGELLLADKPPSQRVLRAVAIGACALVVSSPWWLYNYYGFGSVMPTSGTAQRATGPELFGIGRMLRALSQVGTPSLFLGRQENAPLVVARFALIAGLATIVVRAFRAGQLPRYADLDDASRRTLRFAAYFVIAYAALCLYYVTRSRATWFYLRYMAPLSIVGVLLLTFAISESRGLLRRLGLAGATALALQMVAFAALKHRPGTDSGSPYYNDQLSLVRKYVPEHDRIASGQTGTLGYWREGVVNCDGKVNAEALAHIDHLQEYLDAEHINWWIDESLFPNANTSGWELVATQQQQAIRWVLYRRK
jgi:hypothetical protein